MPKIAIVGSGITGLAAAALLSKIHDVTVIARDLPGDPDSLEWASPWAGAMFMPTAGISPRDQAMQRNSFAFLWALPESNPESGVKRIELHDNRENFTIDQIWYKDLMPNLRVKDKSEMPEGCQCSMVYQTVVMPPTTFLPWLRKSLEDRGVTFERKTVGALADLKSSGYDVVVNATGLGSRHLRDVADQSVHPVRGQTVLVKTDFDRIVARYGAGSTYTIPRLDGTAILGGFKHPENFDRNVDLAMRQDAIRRAVESTPAVFKGGKAENIEIVRDIVGFRPDRTGGIRVEKEILNGQKVVHAYGVGGTGYIYSFGVAETVVALVDELLSTSKSKL